MQDATHAVLHITGDGNNTLRMAVQCRLLNGPLGDSAGQRSYGSDTLGEFVMQFAGDDTPLGIQPTLQVCIHFALGFEPDIVVDRSNQAIRHAVESTLQP